MHGICGKKLSETRVKWINKQVVKLTMLAPDHKLTIMILEPRKVYLHVAKVQFGASWQKKVPHDCRMICNLLANY